MSATGTVRFPITPAPVRARGRRTLLSSCAVASALVVMGHAAPARADGYKATISNAPGDTIGASLRAVQSNGHESIYLSRNEAVVTWIPTSTPDATGAIEFQGVNGYTTFVGPNTQNFTVLNRIVPTTPAPVAFKGLTDSTFSDGTRGGNIWFYSPGGIVASSTSRFDVGSLLLSTNSIAYDRNAGSGYGSAFNANQIRFDGAENGAGTIRIEQGADPTRGLFASGRGANYVALVAPRIVQGGTVSAAQAAYVAAEAGDMTIDATSGLFSFAISAGSTVADALTHSGTTALTAGNSAVQRAFLVAVPKNEAITMLVGGTIRYAAAASVDNGVVVLSSGNVSDGINPQVVNGNTDAIVGGTTDIVIGNGGTFGSIRAAASGRVTNSGGFTATGDVSLFSNTGVSLTASGSGADNAITINRLANGTGGNLSLSTWTNDEDGSRAGNRASLSASSGAAVTIGGGLTIDTSGVAQQVLTPSFAPFAIGPAGPSGTGGTASLSVTDAQMTIAGAVTLNADGVGLGTNANGGSGTGGIATVTTTNGALSIGAGANGAGTGGLIVSANGIGGEGSQGGNGVGNVASITATGLLAGQTNAIRVAGVTTVTANGVGGVGYGFDAGDVPGTGTGGIASITLRPNVPTTGPATQATFSGGGSVTIGATGNGGGGGSLGYGVAGSDGTGGAALLSINGGTFGGGTLTVDASGAGGAGSNTFDNSTPGSGGNGSGGTAGISGSGGNLNVAALTIGAGASGGAGGSSFASGGSGYGNVDAGDGGDATGGRAVLIGASGFAARPTGVLTIDASGTGGAGGTSNSRNGGDAGNGLGGNQATVTTTGPLPGPNGAYVSLQGGSTLSASQLLLRADGSGGIGGLTFDADDSVFGDGGSGIGGSARVTIGTAGSLTATSTTLASRISARGDGGASGSASSTMARGVGGDGLGGGRGTTIGGASIDSAGAVSALSLLVDAGAGGGSGNVSGGDAVGGKASATFTAGGSIARTTLLAVNSSATGATGTTAYLARGNGESVAGGGTGGQSAFTVDGTTLTLDRAVAITASGTGGGIASGTPTLAGGNGAGGSATVTVRNGGSATLNGGLSAAARGTGGGSLRADAGDGAGGAARVNVAGGSLRAGSLTIDGSGVGGRSDGDSAANSHDGGAATGGTAALTIAPSSVGPAGSVTVTGATLVDASATGGLADDTAGRVGFANPSSGGAGTGGGAGTSPGGALVDVQTGTASFAGLTLNAGGTGGISLAGNDGGIGTGGTARLSVGTVNAPGGGLNATSISISATGTGGGHTAGPANEQSTGYGGKGGAGIGGRALLNLYGGTIGATQAVTLAGSGSGGEGGQVDGFSNSFAGDGGVGTGGTAAALVAGGQLTAASLSAAADGTGGQGGDGYFSSPGVGAAGIGGGAVDGNGTSLTGGTGATVSVSGATGAISLTGNLEVSASGTGAAGLAGSFSDDPGSDGGAGTGGAATLTVMAGADGSASNISVRADALGRQAGGAGATGGNAAAGVATIRVDDSSLAATDTTTDDELPPVTLSARAEAGAGSGSATGGTARLSVTGTGTYDGDMVVDVSAIGTDGADGMSSEGDGGLVPDGRDGGSATAGTVALDLASATIDSLSILASAAAGDGGRGVEAGYGSGNGGAGGAATAGTVTLELGYGAIDGLTIFASAAAGNGGGIVENGYGSGGAGGAGGNAGGGPISITARGDGRIGFGQVVEGASIDASRTAGSGGNGGAGASGDDGFGGNDGEAGQAGGAGNAGGSATGALVSLTAVDGGTIALSDGEGSFQVNLAAEAGTGGNGGSGGAGGAGGAGNESSPAGAQGRAGVGGDGGNGGSATGGSLALIANGGTITSGDLSIATNASGARGGNAGSTGSGSAPTPATTGSGGNGTAGNVSIRTSDIDRGETTAFGRLVAGDLTINASGDAGFAGDFSTIGNATSGRVELLGKGGYLSDEDAPTGSISLSSLNVTADGAPPLGIGDPRDPSLASIDILASNGRVNIARDATLNTGYQASLRSANGGTIAVGGALNVSADNYITATQAGDGPNAITANSVDFSAFNGEVIAETPIVATATGELPGTIEMSAAFLDARDLTATDSISLTGTYHVGVGNLTTTAPVNPAATTLAEAGGGTIDIVAGQPFNFDLVPDIDLIDANIDVTGVVSASNRVTMTAGGDINVLGEAGARIESGNLARLDAGDDVFVSGGAIVRAGLTPLADPGDTGPQDLDTPAGLIITAGLQPVREPAPGNPHVIRVDGSLSSGVLDGDTITSDPALRRGILLSGDAVQAEGGIAGRSLTVSITNAPAPDAERSGNVDNLSDGCLIGDACLGALDLTNLLTVGALTGTSDLPTTIRIAGGAATQRTSLRAQGDINLGREGSSTTFDGRDLLRVESLLGAVNLPGDTTLSGGNLVQVLGATGISGSGATIQGDNAVGLYTGSGGLTLASLIAGNLQPITPNAEGEPTPQAGGLSINGIVMIGNLLSVSNGDADMTATGDLSVANVEVGTGNSIALRSTGGDAIVGNAAPSELGTATDIIVSSDTGAATLTAGSAARDIAVTAATSSTVGDITAGDDIALSGTTVDLGSATTTGTFAETGYGSAVDGSNITIDASGGIGITGTADARGDLRLTSSEGAVTANVLTAGDDVIVSGTRLNITSATSRGLLPEAGMSEGGYGATADGSNITLTATGGDVEGTPAIKLDTASAAINPLGDATGDLTVRAIDAAGSIVAGTLAAGRNITVAAGSNVQLANATANGPVALGDAGDPVPTSGFVSITAGEGDGSYGPADINISGTVDAHGLIQATAGGDIVVGSAAKLLSDNRVSLTSGDDIRIASGAVVQAARAPLPSTSFVNEGGKTVPISPAELILNAGGTAINYAPADGNVASLIIDGAISADARPISLTGGAIQADASALTGGTLTINVPNAPAAGAAQSDDGGQLRAGCLQGDVCLGAVTLTGFTAGQVSVPGALRIGSGSTSVPTNVRIAGAVNVAAIDIAAKNSVTLGNSGTAAIVQTAAGPITINAAAGPVTLLGNLTLTGGTGSQPVSITGATGVNGSTANVLSRGQLDISAPNGAVTLASASAPTTLNVTAGQTIRIGQVTGGSVTLTANGRDVAPSTGQPNGQAAVDIGTVDATSSLGINVPQGGIRFANLSAPSIALTSGSYIAGGNATARAGDFSAMAPGSIVLGTVNAGGGIDIDAGGSLSATSLLSAAGSTNPDGDGIAVSADGAIDVGTVRASAGDVTLAAGGALTLGSGNAAGSISLTAKGGNIALDSADAGRSITLLAGVGGIDADRLTARDTIKVNARDAISVASIDAGGAIDILSLNGGIIGTNFTSGVDKPDGSAGITLRADKGSITVNSLDANGDLIVDAGGRVSSLTALAHVRPGGTTGGASGDIRINAGDRISLERVEAARSIRLTSGRDIEALTLRAGADIALAAGGTVVVRTDIAAGGAITATGTGIDLTALGDLNIDSLNATAGDLGLRSGGNIRLRQGMASGNIALLAGGTATGAQAISAGSLGAGGSVNIFASGRAEINDIKAGTSVMVSATGVVLPRVTAGSSINVSSQEAITLGDLTAGDAIFAQTVLRNPAVAVPHTITLNSATAASEISLIALGQLSAGTLTTTGRGSVRLSSNGGINADRISSAGDVVLDVEPFALEGVAIGDGLGGITTGAITASGNVTARSSVSGITLGPVVGNAVTLTAGQSAAADIRLASVTATGGISATASRDITAQALAAGRDLLLTSNGGAIRLDQGTAGGVVTLTNVAPGNVSNAARAITAGTLRAGTGITVNALGDIAIMSAQAVDSIDLRSTGGSITTTDLLATDSITARALGNLFVRDAVATSGNGNVLLAGGFPAATGTTMPYSLDGSATVNGTVSAGRSVIVNGGGRVTIASTGRIRANGTIAIASGDDIVADSGSVIGLGHVTVAAPTGQSGALVGGPADSVTLAAGSLRAGTANAATNGLSAIAMNGSVDGVTIGLTSEAVDVGAGGRVGSAATTQATFTNTAGRTIVGGNGDTSVYSVSNAALGRVRAQRIGIVAPTDVTVQAVTLNGSATTDGNLIGNAAEFRITGGGTLSVEGAVAVNSAAQTDLFAITAPSRIAVGTPSGSIVLNAAGNTPGGRLSLTAPQIIVVTAPAAAALAGLDTLDLRDARLGVSDGALSDTGFIQANSLEFNLGGETSGTRALYIQNSGRGLASEARRGFTAGMGGVSISTGTGSAAEIIINGRQSSADGGFLTGRDLIPALKISGTAQASMTSFDPRSTANGCLIVGVSCRFDVVTGGGDAPVTTPPIQDTINQIVRGQDTLTGAISSVVQQLNSPLIELIDFTPFRLAGIIDEPVTGAGNDDFYDAFAGNEAFGLGLTVDQQVTGSGNDSLINKPLADGRCDPNQGASDPDCR